MFQYLSYICNNASVNSIIESEPIKLNDWYLNNYIDYNFVNLFIVTSVLEPVDTQFSYGKKRSVYTRKERLNQLLKSLSSIKENCPNVFIAVIEASELEEAEIEYINHYSDLLLFADVSTCKIVNDIYKGAGECALLYDILSKIKNKYNYIRGIKSIFKLSGRYYLDEEFKIERYNKSSSNIFRIIEDSSIMYTNNRSIYTFLYKIDINYLDKFIDIVKKGSIELYNSELSVEEYFMLKVENILFVPILGVCGNISVCGTYIKK